MKTLELNLKKRILLVELPKGAIQPFQNFGWLAFKIPALENWATNKEIDNPILCKKYIDRVLFKPQYKVSGIKLPNSISNLQLLGKLSDLKEKDFRSIVEEIIKVLESGAICGGYKSNTDKLETAKESFESAVEAAEYRIGTNRYEDSNGIVISSEITDWQIEEAKTFNPEQTYLFEIKQ